MSTNTQIVVGNLAGDPELRFTPAGAAVANFTVAQTPRTFDRQANEWKDGETNWFRCTAWRDLAENIAESLAKGMEVIVVGTIQTRKYTTKEGENRSVQEIDVDSIGPSLRWASAKVTRANRKNSGSGNGSANASRSNDQPANNQNAQDDEPPF